MKTIIAEIIWLGFVLSLLVLLPFQGQAFAPLQNTHLGTFATPSSSKLSVRVENPWTVHDKDLLHRNFHPQYIPADEVDYIIIGSGIGGLWLAACLAKFNRTSLVLEQHYTAGGLQHSFYTGKGDHRYEFVPGLHYIANLPLCGPLYKMVAVETTPALRFVRAGDAVKADQKHRFCSHELKVGSLPVLHVKEGLENARNELISVFPEEEQAIDSFLDLMEKAKWLAGTFATFRIFPRWLQWILSQFVCSTYIHYASQTTEQVLEKLTDDGRLKTVYVSAKQNATTVWLGPDPTHNLVVFFLFSQPISLWR